MRRSLLTLIAFTALAAWAGAQGPPPPLPAATQAKLFKSNRTLLAEVIDHGIALADADSPLQRAEESRKTATTLARYLGRAAEDQDPDRVAELAGLMTNVVRDGLVPNWEDARDQIRPGDPREQQLLSVRAKTALELDGITAMIPQVGKVGDSQKVKDAITTLQGLKASLGK